MTDITTTLTYTADLTRPLRRMNIPALFITDARRAHRITVTVLRAGNPVDLGDTAVSGTVKHLRTGTTIPPCRPPPTPSPATSKSMSP